MENLPTTAILIGAGGRGTDAYAAYALIHPDELKIVAVCEPDEFRRDNIRTLHALPEERCFSSWEELLLLPVIADTALICTQDQMHYKPAIALMKAGYDLLLEKPMSNNPFECLDIANTADSLKRKIVVCHVLRYTPFFMQVKNLIGNGRIGKIVTIQHSENIAYWHFAMSYVRGAWRNQTQSSPIILAKCCHDMDILNWLIEDECTHIVSFGSLQYFKSENAPAGAPLKCQDGCPVAGECPWCAPRFYLENERFLYLYTDAKKENTRGEKLDALLHSNHGRCVFRSDNDACDSLVALLQYRNGATVTFTMSAFTHDCTRIIRIMGTKGEIIGDMDGNRIDVLDFYPGGKETINIKTIEGDIHFGGDEGIMREFVVMMKDGYHGEIKSSAGISLDSHLMAFAAEESRTSGRIINIDEYKKELQKGKE